MDLTLRPGRPEDGPALGRICYEAFREIATRHGFPPDIPSVEVGTAIVSSMLGAADDDDDSVWSVVAERDGRIIGSNFMAWEAHVAGIGPITVDAAEQDSGAGKAMMLAALDAARTRGSASVRLVQAAYHGRSLSLYTKLGFDPREPLAQLTGTVHDQPAGAVVRRARDEDLDACNRLCLDVHGHDRAAALGHAVRNGTATVVDRAGEITGYSTSVDFIGHSVGRDNDALKALIAAAGPPRMGGFLLPIRNAELFRWCLEQGLRVVQPMTLMSIGLYSEPRGAFLPSVLF
jgi:predicted N-acetyltransferase YhbS